jgi:hypothetical protein
MYNQNAGYWNLMASALTPMTTGKTFYVTSAIGTGKSAQILADIFPTDPDGTQRVFSTITLALAATTAGRGDVIVIANDYTTAPTDAELTTAGTNGVTFVQWAASTYGGEYLVTWASKALPATTTGTLFTITGVVEIVSIIGVVTTVIQTQSCNLKLSTVSNSATTDICADLDISADAAQSRMSITGTFANAMINTAKGVPVARQATSIVAQEGTIIATTSATNTGAIRRSVLYRPLQAGSKVVAA